VVAFGPNANQKYITTYFRTTFQVTDLPSTATIQLMADDGAVVYLNGVEVVHDNMPTGTITDTTRASSGRSGGDENALRPFAVPTELLRSGVNSIAVEVHQNRPDSSDLSFDLDLSGEHDPSTPTTGSTPDTVAPSVPSGVAVTGTSETSVSLSWGASSDDTGVTGYRVFRDGVDVGTT